MRLRLRQNNSNMSDVQIGHQVSIFDVQCVFRTSDIFLMSDIPSSYPMSDIVYQTLDIGTRMSDIISDVRYVCISDVGYDIVAPVSFCLKQ